MKHILILLAMIFFIGCQQEKETLIVENKPRHYGWNLEYFHKVKIQNEDLYVCVYGRNFGSNTAVAFLTLNNTECKEKLKESDNANKY